jgi:hypothetical protein
MYPFKLVSILSEPVEFGGFRCWLAVEGRRWHKSETDGVWNCVLRHHFDGNQVSCLLESDEISTVQRVVLEAKFDQPGLHEDAMLMQFAQSAQLLMYPATPTEAFCNAVIKMGEWSNEQWELRHEPYPNVGFGLVLRSKSR